MNALEGANCSDLPDFVIEKYFHCNVSKQPLIAKAALAICGNCVVMTECRDNALNMSGLQTNGIIGGVRAIEVHRARRWRQYELGYGSLPPPACPRPDWLQMPEAAERIEQLRLELDPEESATDPYRETNPMPQPKPRKEVIEW